MSTNKVEKSTGYEKGSSNTNGLVALFGTVVAESAPEELIYKWQNAEGTETSGLGAGVKGNDDFPAGFDINFSGAPELTDFAPDIRSPGEGITEHPEAGQFGDGTAADLASIPDDAKLAIAEHSSDGSNGVVKDPKTVSKAISAQTIGALLTGQSYPDSGN